MRTRCFVLFWLLTCAVCAQGAWTIVSPDELGSRAGVRHIRVPVENGNEHAELHLAACDLRQTTLRIIDQPNESRATLAEAMQRSEALAGVNGGYFDHDFAPVGLLVAGGRFVAPKRKARLLSGILSVSNGRVRLQRSADFSSAGKVSEAVQCGPFLLERRRAVAGLDNTRAARRTFAGLNGNRFVLGFCSPVTLADLARILAALSADDALAMERAVNLDGGSSSAFWVAAGETPFSIAGFKEVRDFVAVVRRETADR